MCFEDNVAPESWNFGSIYSLIASSTFVRITPRGLQYSLFQINTIPKIDYIYDKNSKWNTIACEFSNNALCKNFQDDKVNMVVFPTSDDVIVPLNTGNDVRNSYLTLFSNNDACTSMNTGRIVSVSDTSYELSLCDLLDSNLDLLFFKTENQTLNMFWRKDTTDAVFLTILAFLSIYLVSCIAQNIVSVLTKPVVNIDRFQLGVTLFVVILLWGTFILFEENLFLITQDDKRMLWHLLLFVTVDWIVQFSTKSSSSVNNLIDFFSSNNDSRETDSLGKYQRVESGRDFDDKKYKKNTREIRDVNESKYSQHARQIGECNFFCNISILIACLALISLRIHFTLDNPYINILTVLFGIRTWYKLLWVSCHTAPLITRVFQIWDMYIFCSFLGNGISVSHALLFDGVLYQFIVLFICFLTASLLLLYREIKFEDMSF